MLKRGFKRALGIVITLMGILGTDIVTAKPQRYKYPFQNPGLGMEERVTHLLSLMNREEKIRCLSTQPDVPRLGVKGTGHVEGLHGLAMGEGGGHWAKWGGGAVPTTQFPQAVGLGETWNPELVREVGAAEGREIRYLWESTRGKRGGMVTRAPNADLARDPRWGRTEESFGEDPHLVGVMATAMTRGLQGNDPRHLQCASLLKHFLSNSNEKDRARSSSNYDERLFHEYYAEPFRRAIQEGRAQGVMAAYNAVNGMPCHVHPMLKDVLQGMWGFDGILCTDGGGLKLLVSEHKFFKDLDAAAAACVTAGINQFLDKHTEAVREALDQGLLTEEQMDESLRGVFRVMIRLGMLDPKGKVPYPEAGDGEPWLGEEHRALALRASRESVVLLKNAREMLPLDADKIRSVAVIGPNAQKVWADWYGGDPPYTVSPLEGIRSRVGGGVRVEFAKDNQDGAAVKAAKNCDVAIVCAGNHPTGNGGWGYRDSPAEGKESMDREVMDLRQEDLIRRVVKANPRTVVVVVGSFPFTMGDTVKRAPALLHLAHSGQETGTAVAGALFGDFNPGGRLVHTWPRSMKQLPPMMDYDIRRGRTYMYFKGKPLFPFGYGLSYTTFGYSDVRLSKPMMTTIGQVTVTVDIANTGHREGDEVVQLYVRFPDSKMERPNLQLKGFQRVALMPGEKRTLAFILTARDLAYWDVASKDWKVEDGKVEICVGPSSAELLLKRGLEVHNP